MAANYKETLLLPKTEFPMEASLGGRGDDAAKLDSAHLAELALSRL